MPFKNISEYADYRSKGAWHQATYLRTSSPVGGAAGKYIDTSVGAGHPVYNPYAGTALIATPLINNNSNRAVYTGPNPGPGEMKYLHSLTVDSTSSLGAPGTHILCDYLLYYPFIDLDSTDMQTLDNTATLPRYTTGEGVQCFVSLQAPTTGVGVNGLCTVVYTNSDGVSGRTTTFSLIGASSVGVIANGGSNSLGIVQSQCSPFIPLVPGDKGIRSIESVQMSSGIGGLAAFVLCTSIASIPLFSIAAQTEKTFFSRTGRAPKIEQGAFLHFISQVGGTAAINIFRSSLTFVWG